MIRLIELSPVLSTLRGNWEGGDTVIVKCDATEEAFTVQVPDAKNNDQVTYKFVKTDSTNNIVTLSARTDLGQKLSNEDTQELLTQGDMIIYNSDGIGYW